MRATSAAALISMVCCEARRGSLVEQALISVRNASSTVIKGAMNQSSRKEAAPTVDEDSSGLESRKAHYDVRRANTKRPP
jgi:hypothetical protein